ncbi:hypothetical protein CONLIGDRAFT_701524 [Coniochaeta ligniaria NRRL 30616]|uniref:Uncharacterized protein n=1 Tax=Coniochaeta ligniaria NRRL 30616 TaxID=1408157 RepID=A0A1J7IPN0_9PEZI|nr:hypothetical protein CONLIGDRAFT_701524 [Coniochaeta ligniaria NRRL 30616]
MCIETTHWRFCGHHTSSWEFCHNSKVETILVRSQTDQPPHIGQADKTIQQLSDNEFYQHLKRLDLAYHSSSPTSSPTSSTSSSPSPTKSTPPSPPTSPTSPPGTPSPPRKTKLNHTTLLAPISIRRISQRLPCTRRPNQRNDYSHFRSICNDPDICDYERVGRQWACCVCGKGPNRTVTCYRTLEAWPLGQEGVRREVCGHELCDQCEAYGEFVFLNN